MTWRLRGRAVVAALVFGGCGSESGPPAAPVIAPVVPGMPSKDPVSGDTPAAPGGDSAARECPPGRLSRRAVWLSDIQFAKSISQLLGPAALGSEQTPDVALKPFSQKGVVVNTSLLRSRLDLAEHAAASVKERFSELTGCGATDDGCARAFIAKLAAQAFRRPVPAEELSDLSAVYEAGRETDVATGTALAVQAILAAPSFSYRTEYGVGDPDSAGNVRLSDDELASLLSFWLTDGPPDAELAAAAAAGKLSDRAELERQVTRVLSSPEARDSLTLTLMAAWDMGNLFGASKDPALFPEYGPLLQSNMFEETRLFLNQALWSDDGSLGDVLTSRRSFVNQALAQLYGVPFTGSEPTEFVPVELPAAERAGLLTQASLLSARARSDNTSVVARGLFVRSSLLCLQRPPPPPEAVIAQVQALLAADLTERERADFRAMTSPCNGCHASVDSFGLMLENYDAIGRYREDLQGTPIDSNVELGNVGFPGTFAGAVAFADAAAESPDFSACVARHLAVYATGDDGLATRDCELDELRELAPTETNLSQIVTSLASSALLRTRSGE